MVSGQQVLAYTGVSEAVVPGSTTQEPPLQRWPVPKLVNSERNLKKYIIKIRNKLIFSSLNKNVVN